jgi:SAM-dependent methyltransferase
VTGERGDRLHSAEFFGPERDHWWNLDQLALIASRVGLGDVVSVLDVGCGVGHWGRLLGGVLPGQAQIVGVDREPSWVCEASARSERLGLSDRFRYVEGRAEALPFPDACFDLVTCQTVLIHVESPPAVIGEMLRVAKPGAVILAAEPNNRAAALVATSNTAAASIDELLDEARFLLICERGKVALGEGDNSVGDLVPGYFAQHGVDEIQTFIADRPAALVPPYASEGQQALRDYVLREAQEGTVGWIREDAQRFFIAGGGSAADFDGAWERRLQGRRLDAQALRDGTFHTAGGTILYVVAGRKPATGGTP